MKQMKKVLAMILCLAMCLSMFPASAFAEEGSSEAPTEQVEEPAYEEPAYEEPAYEEPAYEEPAYEEPANEEPVNEEPVNEEPVNEEPVNEEPVNVEPVNEEPVNEEPVNVEPVNEEPVNGEPVNEEPVNGAPNPEEPETAQPVRVVFDVPAEEATVRVYTKDENLNEADVTAEEDGSFLLLPGQYYYKVNAEGYAETEETEFTVETSEEILTVAVELTLSATGSDADSKAAALTVAQILTGEGRSFFIPENAGTDDGDLLTEYAAQQLEKAKPARGGMLMAPGRPTSGLNPAQAAAYDILRGYITETAAGDRPLTQYDVTFDSGFIAANLTWTPETLPGGGYESFTIENWAAAAEQGYEATMALGPIHTALLNTLPYELYWYDKTMGVMSSYSFSATQMSDGSISNVYITGVTFIFTVAQAYSDGVNYALDSSGTAIRNPDNGRAYPIGVRNVGSTINDAVVNAQAVVNNCSAFTDLGKLTEYKNYICSQVSYNHAAAADDYDLGYGDPWQLIYAFDNDASTNIVCEGYSKAFEYLCDLSTFSDGNVRAYCVTGTMDGGTGAGAHMWNIVSMDDGRNYLVDVTNCDEGSVGSPDQLFLKGCARGNADEGYVFSCNDGNSEIAYVYDSDTRGYYNTEELTVSAYDYGYAPSALDQLKTAISNMTTPYSLGNVTALTITEDLEIPAGMRVEAPNAVITIPAGVNLTVNGTLFLPGGQNGLSIEAGGVLEIGEDGKVELHGAPYLTTVNGDLRVGGRLYLSRGHWGNLNDAGSLANIATVGESSEIHVEMLVQVQESLDQMLDVMSSTNVPEALAEVTRLDFTIAFPWTLEHDYDIPAGINVHIQNNGTNETGSVTVPAGSSLTVNGYFALRSAEMTVNGTLINNGTIHLRAGGQTGTASTLTLSNGATCLGDGEVQVYYDAANELIDNTGLLTQISDDGSVIVYRLAEQPDNTSFETAIELTDGQTFEVTGSENGVTRYYKFTPTQSNYYGFKCLDDIWVQDLGVYASDHTRIGYGKYYYYTYSLPYLNAGETYYFALNIGEEVTASLRFGYDNRLRVYPADDEWEQLVPVGERAVLRVSVEGSDLTGISYQWSGPSGNLAGETSDTLTTDPITTRTYYSCTVTDRYGNEDFTQIQVGVDNGLTVTLADHETNPYGYAILQFPLGESFTLTANVEAYEREGLTFRWSKYDDENYEELPETGNSITDTVTGRTNYSLYVTDRYENYASLNIEIRVDNQLTAFVDGTNEVAKTYFVNPGETVTMKARVSAEVTTEMSYHWDYSVFYKDGRVQRDSVASSGPELVSIAMEENIESIHYAFQVQDCYRNYKTVDFYLLPWPVCSGSCGDNADWNFDIDSNTLTVTGTGAVQAYSYSFDPMNGEISSDIPWHHLRAYIKRVVMSEGITDPGNNTFKGLDELRTLELPGSLERIPVRMLQESPADDVFFGGTCAQWRALEIPFPNGNLMAATVHCSDGNADMSAWSGSQTDWTLTDGTLTISGTGATWDYAVEDGGVPAWYNMKDQIDTVNISEGITEIGGDNFNDMPNLTRVTIPEGVVAIGESAFQNAVSLESIDLPSTLKTINWYAFMGCRSLTEIRFRSGLETIGMMAFAGCENLSTAYIPASVTQIGAGAFNGTGLTTVYYTGTQDQWSAIEIGENNAPLVNAQIVFGSQTDPATDSLPTPTNLKWNQAWHGQPENGMMYFEYEGDTAYGVVVSLYRDGVAQAIYEGDQWATVNTRADRPGVMLCHSAWFRFNSRDLESGTYYFTVKLVSDGGEESELATSPSWIYTAPNASVPAPEVNGIVYTAEKELAPDFTVTGSEEYPNIQFALEYRPDVNSEEGSKKVERSYSGQYNPISNSKPFMNETMRSDGYGEGWYRIGVMVNSSDITVAKNSETVYSEWQFISAGQIAGTVVSSLPLGTSTAVDNNVTARFAATAAGYYKIAYDPSDSRWGINVLDVASGEWSYYSGGTTLKLEKNETVYFRPNYSQSSVPLKVVIKKITPPTADSVAVAKPTNVTNHSATFTFTYSATEATAENGYAVGIELATDKDFIQLRGRMSNMQTYDIANNETMTMTFPSFYPGESFWYRAILVDNSNGNILKTGSTVNQLTINNDLNGYIPLTKDRAVVFRNGGENLFYYEAESAGMLGICSTGTGTITYTMDGNNPGGHSSQGGDLVYGTWLDQGQRVYITAYNPRTGSNGSGNTCSIEVKDGLGVLPSLEDGESVQIFPYIVASYIAQQDGLHQFSIDNEAYSLGYMLNDGVWRFTGRPTFSLELNQGDIVWIRFVGNYPAGGPAEITGGYVDRSAILENLKTAIANGEGYFDLRGLLRFELTENLTIPENMHVDFWGTQLEIPENVTLTVLGSMSGEFTEIGGTVNVQGGHLYQNGILFTNNNAALNLNGNGGAVIPVDSWTDNVKTHVHFSGNSYLNLNDEAYSSEELNAAKGRIGTPTDHVTHWININFPWTLMAGRTETIPQNAAYEFANGGSLTVAKNATLNIYGGLKLRGTTAEFSGKVNNEGWLELETDEYGRMGQAILNSSGSFTGAGEIRVRATTEPQSWLQGFDSTCLQEKWSDAYGVCYTYTAGLFAALEAACNSGAERYDLNGVAALTIMRDLTIPANMHVDAWNAVVTVPSGVTLTVNGFIGLKGIVLEDGGTLRFGDGAHGNIAESIILGETAVFSLGRDVNLDVSVMAWNGMTGDSQAGIGFTDESSRIWLYSEAYSDEELQNAIDGLSLVHLPAGAENHFGKNVNIYYGWMPSNGFIMAEDTYWHVVNNGVDLGSITIEPGNTLMMNGYLCLHGATMTVNGKLYNDGCIDLQTENGNKSVLSLGPDGEYEGDGSVQIKHEDPESELFGFTDYTLSILWEDQWSTAYQIIEGVVTVYRYGDSFYANNTMPVQFMVEESGIYTMNVALPEGCEGWISIGNTPVEEWVLNEGGNEITTLLQQGVVYELLFGSDSASEAEIHLNEPQDAIISGEAWDIRATSAQLWVGLSVTEATAAAGDYIWGIKYSMDENLPMDQWLLWGWNVDHQAYRQEFKPHDLCTLIPNTTYYYKAILFRTSETQEIAEVIAEEEAVHMITTAPAAEGEIVPLNEGESRIVARNTHQVFTFDATAYEYYIVSGSNLDYISFKDSSGDVIRYLYVPSEISGDGRTYAYFALREDQTVYIGTGSHGTAQGDITVTEAVKTATALSADNPVKLTEKRQAVKFTAPVNGWYEIAVTGSEAVLAMVDFEKETWYTPGTARNIYLERGQTWIAVAGGAGATVKVTRSGSDLAENLAYLGTRDINYYFNLNEPTAITDAVTVPRNVRLNINAPVTVEDTGVLTNYGDIFIENGGSLILNDGGRLVMVDGNDGWKASVSLEGGSLNVTGGEVTYGDESIMVINCHYYDGSWSEGLEHIQGVPGDRIQLEYPISSEQELYACMGSLTAYRQVNVLLEDELELELTGELPGNFCLVINEGSSVIVPDGEEADVYGGFALEGGSLINNGTLNLYGFVNYQRSDSVFENNGELVVSGWIGVNSWHEGNTSGTLRNNGNISLAGGTIEPEVTVAGSEPQPIECIAIDEANFPDGSFRAYVLDEIDTNHDGQLSDEEIDAVTEISVDGMEIGSLRGIECFTSLEILSASENDLTELDLSANTALTDLDVSNNRLSSLNLSNCPNLRTLNVTGNHLTRLDLRSCPGVSVACDDTVQLITEAPADIEITEANFPDPIFRSYIAGFDTIDTDGILSAEEISAMNGKIDVSGRGISSLQGIGFFTELRSLKAANNSLTSLDLSGNADLAILDVSGNQLATLNISGCQALLNVVRNGIMLSQNGITRNWIEERDAQGQTVIIGELRRDASAQLTTGEGVEINVANFPDANFRAYVAEHFDLNDTGTLDAGEIANVTEISLWDENYEPVLVSNLQGIEFFPALNTLWVECNNVTSLDLSANQHLKNLICKNNEKLTSVDLNHNTALRTLFIEDNNLSKLDVSANANLEMLHCGNNPLTVLDLSHNPALEDLEVYETKLSKLDVHLNECLRNVVSYDTPLTSFTPSTALENLGLGNAKLSTLNVSNCLNLMRLSVTQNSLITLDVSANTALTYLNVSNNRLTKLDVSANSGLSELDCRNNQLTNLTLGENSNLSMLNCSGNQKLANVDLSNCDNLKNEVTRSDRIVGLNSGIVTVSVDEQTVLTYDSATKLVLGQEELSGTCGAVGNGSNLTWTLDPAGTLNIAGSGAMKNFASAAGTPWVLYADSINSVLIGSTVTTIGTYAFADCPNLQEIHLAGKLPTIGADAFKDVTATIYYPGTQDYTRANRDPHAYGASELVWNAEGGFDIWLDPNGGSFDGLSVGEAVDGFWYFTEREYEPAALYKQKVFGEAGVNMPIFEPTREGYVFQGWSQTATGSVRYKAGQAFTENVNRTLYAVWKADTFKVNFNKNNDAATGNMNPQAMTVGKALALTANAFRYTNNAFVGWALTKDRADVGIVDFVNRESVSDVILLQKIAQYTASLKSGEENVFDGFNLYEGKEITFYAVWKSNAIAVKLYSEYEIADDGSTNYLAEQTLIAEGDTFTVDMSAIPSISLAAAVGPYYTDDEGNFLAAISADQNVKWTTSSATIATVDETGTVRFVKPGTVTITATTTDGTNKRATVKFSIYYIDPGTRLTAKLAETSAWYEVPTAIGLQNGDIARINIYGTDTTTPMDPDLFQYDIVTKGGEDYLEFISNGQVTALQGGNKAISIKATLLNDPQKRSVTVNLKTIDPQTKVIDMTQEVTPGAGTDLTWEDGVIYLEKKASVQTLTISPHVKDVATLPIPLKRGLLTYASTNRATATTAENAAGAVTVTIPANATGAATITATSKDLAKTVGSLSVYVMDYEPRTDVKSVTLDTHMGTTAEIPLVISNGNEIKNVSFEEYNAKDRSFVPYDPSTARLHVWQNNVLTEDEKQTTVIANLYASTGIPNSTVKGRLAVQTQRPNPNTETGLYYYDLNVVSKSTIPAITVKQTPFNTFFKDSESTVTITARNAQIEWVELNDGTIFRSEGFYMDGESGVVTLHFDDGEDIFPEAGSTAAFNPTAAQKTGTLSIKLQGYVNPVQQPITVQTNNVRPTLKLSAASAILNPTLDGNIAATTLVDSKTNVPYDLNISNPTEQLVVADKTPLAAVSNEGSTFIVELNTYNAKGDLQGGRVTMNVQDDRWTQAIAYSYTLTVNNTMPKLTPTQATLTVNKLFPEVFATTTVISNQGGTNLSDVYFGDATITPATGKDKLSVTCIDGIITAAIADESIPNGTYTCTFAPEYRGTKLANMTVRVTVNNLQPTASLAPASVSLSGFCETDEAATTIKLNNDSLNIMDVMVRDTKGADIYDPNYTGVVPFDIRYQDGSIVIHYLDGAVQKAASYTYQLVAIMNEGQQIMDNGGLYVQLAKPVNLTIRTVDDRPTLKAAKTSFTLNSAFGTTDSTDISLVNVPGQKIIALFEEPNNTTAATITGFNKLSFEETFANGGVSGLTISVNPDKTAYSVPVKLTALVQRDDGVIESKPLVINIRAVNTTPNVTLTSPTLTINREKPGTAVSAINVPAGYSFAGFSEMEETGVYGDGNAILTLSNGRLQARLTQSAIDANKNGSYRFTLTPIVMDANTGLTAACSAKITASVSNTSSKTWSVTVTPSGKLDAVQRFSDEGKLTCTITRMTGIQGIPTAATLENVGVGKYAELFQVSGVRINEKGQPYVVVSLKDWVDYATNINYNNLKLSFTFATADGAGERVDSQVLSLKVTQTALKLTANPTKQTFYQSQDKNRTVTYAIELTSPAYANMNDLNVSIGDIKLWQNAMKDQADDIRFELKKGSEGRILLVHVTLKDPAQLAAGRNYTLPVLIKAEGAASNMAATVVNLTLAVQK